MKRRWPDDWVAHVRWMHSLGYGPRRIAREFPQVPFQTINSWVYKKNERPNVVPRPLPANRRLPRDGNDTSNASIKASVERALIDKWAERAVVQLRKDAEIIEACGHDAGDSWALIAEYETIQDMSYGQRALLT